MSDNHGIRAFALSFKPYKPTKKMVRRAQFWAGWKERQKEKAEVRQNAQKSA